MGGTPEEVEKLWRANKQKHKKVRPWFARPKGLRGAPLIKYFMILGGALQDRRFDDCINALFEHGIVDPRTHEFIADRQPDLGLVTKQLKDMHARVQQGATPRKASRQVAIEWGLGNSLEAGAKQLRDLYKKYERVVKLVNT
jgi:hypothetical protein